MRVPLAKEVRAVRAGMKARRAGMSITALFGITDLFDLCTHMHARKKIFHKYYFIKRMVVSFGTGL